MRNYNFSAGPSMLPLEVLEKVQSELLDYAGTGMSVMEMSHRSKPYEAINAEAEANLRELMRIPENYDVIFVQGGASTQFEAAQPVRQQKSRLCRDRQLLRKGLQGIEEVRRYGRSRLERRQEFHLYSPSRKKYVPIGRRLCTYLL